MNSLRDRLTDVCEKKNPDLRSIVKLLDDASSKEVVQICLRNPSVFRWVMIAARSRPNLHPLRLDLALQSVLCLMKSTGVERSSLDTQSAVDLLLLHLDTDTWSSKDLSQLVDLCVNELDEGKFRPLNTKWLLVFAKLISVTGERGSMMVAHDDEQEIDGKDYRKKLIRKLCLDCWSPEDAPYLTEMFRDVSALTADELDMVVEKTASVLKVGMKQKPDEVPPLVYQVLVLCRSSANRLPNTLPRILCSLAKLYGGLSDGRDAIDSANILESSDVIGTTGNDASSLSVCQSEGTVIFHLTHAVKMGHPIERDIMKLLRSSCQIPGAVFGNSFLLFLALAVSSVKKHGSLVVDCLRAAACKSVALEVKSDANCWLRETISRASDLSKRFQSLMERISQFGGWDLVGQGVVRLAMCLLDSNASPFVKHKVSRQTWQLSNTIVSCVVRFHSEAVAEILSELVKRIVYYGGSVQYTDSLRLTVRDGLPVILEEPKTIIQELLDQIGTLSVSGAKRVFAAIMPLIKAAGKSLRDSAILTLRKGLFSSSSEARKIAIIGVLQFLKYFRTSTAVSSRFGLSQTLMSQSSSGLSQIAADVHRGVSPPNEALCLELLGVLKRGLWAQASVRLTLYQGLKDVVDRNPDLCLHILNLLYQHAVDQRMTNPNAISPVDMGSMVFERESDAVVMEPVGWFIHCLQLLQSRGRLLHHNSDDEDEEDADVSVLDKCNQFLEHLSEKYSNMDLLDMQFEKQATYSRSTLPGRVNALRVDCFKNVLEALMEFIINHGFVASTSKAQTLIRLQKKHEELNSLLKISQPSKGAKRDKKKAAVDVPAAANLLPTGNAYQVPEHAYSLGGLSVLLQAILLDRKPAHNASLLMLRERYPFQKYFLRVILEKLSQIDKALANGGGSCGEDGKDDLLKNLISITDVLLKNCLQNEEADHVLLVPSLECLAKSLSLAHRHFRDRVDKFYVASYLGSQDKSSVEIIGNIILESLAKVEAMRATISKSQNDEEERDICIKSVCLFLQLATFLAKELPVNMPKRLELLKKVNDWTKGYIEKHQNTDGLRDALELLFATTSRVRYNSAIVVELSRAIHAKLGDLQETIKDDDYANSFGYISKATAPIILEIVLGYVNAHLDAADVVVARCKQTCINREVGLLANSVAEQSDLTACETSVCRLLGHLANAAGELIQTELDTGPGLDELVKVLTRFYSTSGLLAKYFFVRCKNTRAVSLRVSRFDKLVTKIGDSLTKNVYNLINYCQVKEKEDGGTKGSGKKKDNVCRIRALKDAKTIPNLVFKIEAFEKDVIKLCKRCNIDLLEDLPKCSTSRDFRLLWDNLGMDNPNHDQGSGDQPTEDDKENSEHNAESTRLDDAEASTSSRSSSQVSVIRAGVLNADPGPPVKKMKVN